MPSAYLIVNRDLAGIVYDNWMVQRVSDWDDSGRVFMAIEHDVGGVYDLVIGDGGPRLVPDADV